MKKIMIMMAIATMAVVSQGAMVKWQFTATKANAAAGDGLTVYMVLGSAWDGTTAWTSTDAIIDASVASSVFTVGSKSASSTPTSFASKDLAIGEKLDYYLIMVDTANNKYYSSDLLTSSAAVADGVNDMDEGVLLPVGTASIDKFAAGNGLATPENWTNVPEPTSGLLFLLGAAALALRRKQK